MAFLQPDEIRRVESDVRALAVKRFGLRVRRSADSSAIPRKQDGSSAARVEKRPDSREADVRQALAARRMAVLNASAVLTRKGKGADDGNGNPSLRRDEESVVKILREIPPGAYRRLNGLRRLFRRLSGAESRNGMGKARTEETVGNTRSDLPPEKEYTGKCGGLRLRGMNRVSLPGQPLVTVIVVVLNEVENLRRTLDSVRSQTYGNIELVVIDGGSARPTLDVLKQFEDAIDIWRSEPDGGIYDAMNKGVELAGGEWICFLNCGDCFYRNDTVQTVFDRDIREADFIYGHTDFLGGDFRGVVKAWDFSILWKTMIFTHQSLFTRRSILKSRPFDTSFRICADFDLIYESWASGKKFLNSDTIIASFHPRFLRDEPVPDGFGEVAGRSASPPRSPVPRFLLSALLTPLRSRYRFSPTETPEGRRPAMTHSPVGVRMLKTHYPHWGSHTAFNALPGYFDPEAFRVVMNESPLGDRNQIEKTLYRIFLRRWTRDRLREYRWNDWRAECGLFRRSLFGGDVDIIHFLDAEHGMLRLPDWFRKFRKIRSCPKVVAMYHQPPAVLEKIMDGRVAAMADHVVTVAPSQTGAFARFLPPERISTILLGVDTDVFKPAAEKAATGKFRCLGGGVWLRDYPAVIETAKRLAHVKDIEFHLVTSAFKVPSAAGNVFFHQGISDAALLDLYRNCQVLFMPLKDATANTFLLEGSACGLPVVSSDLPSLRTYFPGEEAVLVKNNDPDRFSDVLLGLFRAPEKLARMSRSAVVRARQLSWEKNRQGI